jgi:hypothetical protein
VVKEITQSAMSFAAGWALAVRTVMTREEFLEMADKEYERLRLAQKYMEGKAPDEA